MPTYGTLKRDLAALVGDHALRGVATSGSASTLVDTVNLGQADDTWIDHYVYVYAGTGVGQERRITDSDQSSTNVTVSPNWATNPDATSYYFIYRRFQIASYDAALLTALRWLRDERLVPVRDVSTILGDPAAAASFLVDISSLNLVSILRITREDGNNDDIFNYPLPGPHQSSSPWWWVEADGSTVYLRLSKDIHDANSFVVQGRDLEIVGQAYETEPTADTSTITVNPAPVLTFAALLLRFQEATSVADLAALRDSVFARMRPPRRLGRVWAGALRVQEL